MSSWWTLSTNPQTDLYMIIFGLKYFLGMFSSLSLSFLSITIVNIFVLNFLKLLQEDILTKIALGRPRGMVWGGRREEGSGWGTHVYLWRIHFDIWQN